MNTPLLQSLTETLTVLYHRPTRVLNDYAEESVLAQIARRPGVMDELQEVMNYRQRLPAREKRFFPASLYSLLCHWQEVLDRARMYEPMAQDRSVVETQADKFIRKMQKDWL